MWTAPEQQLRHRRALRDRQERRPLCAGGYQAQPPHLRQRRWRRPNRRLPPAAAVARSGGRLRHLGATRPQFRLQTCEQFGYFRSLRSLAHSLRYMRLSPPSAQTMFINRRDDIRRTVLMNSKIAKNYSAKASARKSLREVSTYPVVNSVLGFLTTLEKPGKPLFKDCATSFCDF